MDQKTKPNARANPYMIILCSGTTTTLAPPDFILELVVDSIDIVFVPFLTTPVVEVATSSDVGLVTHGAAVVGRGVLLIAVVTTQPLAWQV